MARLIGQCCPRATGNVFGRRALLRGTGVLLLAGCSGLPGSDEGTAPETARSVDRPGRKHTPTPNAAGQTMLYFGGPVIPNAKVYVVWWGNPANLNPAITAARGGIADFYAGVMNSNYIDWLNEYDTNLNAQAGSHLNQPGTQQHIQDAHVLRCTRIVGARSGTGKR